MSAVVIAAVTRMVVNNDAVVAGDQLPAIFARIGVHQCSETNEWSCIFKDQRIIGMILRVDEFAMPIICRVGFRLHQRRRTGSWMCREV